MAPAKGLVFVLFLRDDLEVLVESHFELAILALDVAGLIAVGGDVEIVGLDEPISASALEIAACASGGTSSAIAGRDVAKASTSALINILVMGDSLKGRKLSATSPSRTELVLFLLAGDLEVLIERHVVLAVLALDIVGLVALALGDDVGFFDRAPMALIAASTPSTCCSVSAAA